MDSSDMAELQRLGVPSEQLHAEQRARAAAEAADPAAPTVAAHLWPAVRLFGAMGTQWDFRTLEQRSVRSGLNYNRIDRTARGIGMTRRQADSAFRHLQVMEDEVLKALGMRAGVAP
jgi:hypothetical protein